MKRTHNAKGNKREKCFNSHVAYRFALFQLLTEAKSQTIKKFRRLRRESRFIFLQNVHEGNIPVITYVNFATLRQRNEMGKIDRSNEKVFETHTVILLIIVSGKFWGKIWSIQNIQPFSSTLFYDLSLGAYFKPCSTLVHTYQGEFSTSQVLILYNRLRMIHLNFNFLLILKTIKSS